MLYKKDYINLKGKELNEVFEFKSQLDNIRRMNSLEFAKLDFHDNYLHYFSIFPNNFINQRSLGRKEHLESVGEQFRTLLDNSSTTEREALNFINTSGEYNLIASLFRNTEYGHHDRYLFKEFELTSTYKADYLLVGKNSGGYHFLFVELESPHGQITLSNGELGKAYRNGIKQVEDWDNWLEGNFHSLRLIFDKHTKPGTTFPKEFLVLDKTRISYAVIAGRRKNYNENTYNIRRKLLQRSNIKLLHYDNLLDSYLDLCRLGDY